MNHYKGLVADWYDDFLSEEYADLDLYIELVAEHGGPALELACGTGRLLVALHRAGIDADGIDISADMLERCHTKTEAAGFSPGLQLAPMQDFSMGRKYRSILVAGGSFQLLTDNAELLSSLQCIHRHLEPGGRLFIDVDVAQPGSHAAWTVGRIAQRGGESLVYSSTNTFDPVTQLNTIQTRYELLRDGRLDETLMDSIVMRVFSRYEMELLLQLAGFTVRDVLSVQLFDAHPGSVLFIAGNR